jgi:hypothetical protein
MVRAFVNFETEGFQSPFDIPLLPQYLGNAVVRGHVMRRAEPHGLAKGLLCAQPVVAGLQDIAQHVLHVPTQLVIQGSFTCCSLRSTEVSTTLK